jgi:methyl-accepting chemotaxis protein
MSLRSRAREVFGRLRVGQQLYGAFAIVLAITAVVGGMALDGMARTHVEAEILASKWLQGVGYLATTRAAVLESRDFEVKHSRAEDRSYHAEYEEKMANAAKTAASAMAAYEGLVAGDTERSLLATFRKTWAAYQQAQQKIVALGRDKKRQDAADISDGQASMAIDEVTNALEELTKYNFSGGKAAAEQAAAVYSAATQMLIALLGAALLFGVLLAYAITRRLLSQLGGEPRAAAEVALAVAGGNLTTRIQLKPGDSDSLMAQLDAMQRGLAGTITSVRTGSQNVATASKQIASGNADLSQRNEEQASSLEETASSMEELTSTVKQNAENARQANQLAVSASEVAVKGGQVVSEVVGTMSSINESSKKIVDIISVIDGIAFQTNILALNAAVEAARAGEQGRGFAVVASEVRNLAQRSAAAAKEIKQLIGDSVDKVGAGTKLVDEAGKTMQEIVTSVKRVTDIMSEITAASQEQSAGIEQVNQAITQMDEVTQQNAALVEEAAAAAESLEEQAQQLTQAVSVFKLARSEEPAAVVAKADRPMTSVTHLLAKKTAISSHAVAEKKLAIPQVRKVANARHGSDAAREAF